MRGIPKGVSPRARPGQPAGRRGVTDRGRGTSAPGESAATVGLGLARKGRGTVTTLLSCVGNRDPWAEDQSEGAILTCVRHVSPDRVYLYPSPDTPRGPGTGVQAECTEAEVLRLQPGTQVFVRPLRATPVDYAPLLADLREVTREAVEGDLVVNVTSGTPHMRVAWLLLVNSGLLGSARVVEVAAPSFVSEDTPAARLRDVDIGFLREEVELDRIRRLLADHLYARAGEEIAGLSKTTRDAARAQRLGAYARLFRAWARWDGLSWEDALRGITEAAAHLDRFEPDGIKRLVAQQRRVLLRLGGGEFAGLLPFVDIHHQARRRLVQGQYAECLARFWRIEEGVLRALLDREGINARDLRASAPRTDAARAALRSVGGERQGLNIPEMDRLAGELAPAFAHWQSTKIAVSSGTRAVASVVKGEGRHADGGLRRLRNDSVLGHGMAPVSPGQALDSLIVSRALLEWAVGQIPGADVTVALVEAYPFSGGAVPPVAGVPAAHIATVQTVLAGL